MKRTILGATIAIICSAAAGRAYSQTTLNIWPGVAPGSEHWTWSEKVIPNVVDHGTHLGTIIQDVVTPTLTAYLPTPDNATGTGIIIAPGGACIALVMDREGRDIASRLQQKGIAAFVLKYRLMHKLQDGMPKDLDEDEACKWGNADAIQALKVVREHAAEWHISPRKVGILGFSAGGMLASEAVVQKDAATRPAFAGLIYGAPFSSMPQVPEDLPPIFMAWAQDDATAGYAMVRFYAALLKNDNSPEAHIYVTGGHGFAIPNPATTSAHWFNEFYWWLQTKGFAPPSVPPHAAPLAKR
ncbi:MAG: alpha/beta hydrolase [Gemmatimonadaceae bacterium]